MPEHPAISLPPSFSAGEPLPAEPAAGGGHQDGPAGHVRAPGFQGAAHRRAQGRRRRRRLRPRRKEPRHLLRHRQPTLLLADLHRNVRTRQRTGTRFNRMALLKDSPFSWLFWSLVKSSYTTVDAYVSDLLNCAPAPRRPSARARTTRRCWRRRPSGRPATAPSWSG